MSPCFLFFARLLFALKPSCHDSHFNPEVKASGERITLLHPDGYDYYRLLRSKLHWGRGSPER